MYRREKRVLLRHYLEQGFTKTAIAENLRGRRRDFHDLVLAKQMRQPPHRPGRSA